MAVADALQYAIYDRLTTLLDAPVYAHVPDNLQGSYVVIGDDTLIDWSTDCKSGFEATVTIHTWTVPGDSTKSFRGPTTCKKLQGEIYNALHRQDFAVSGYQNLGCDQEFQEVMQDSDGLSYHGVQRFRIYLDTDSTIS